MNRTRKLLRARFGILLAVESIRNIEEPRFCLWYKVITANRDGERAWPFVQASHTKTGNAGRPKMPPMRRHRGRSARPSHSL